MDLEELDKVVLFLAAADSLNVEDFAEVGVAFVCNVKEVGLHEGFWRRGLDLEGLEEGFNLGETGVDALDEACWCWGREER